MEQHLRISKSLIYFKFHISLKKYTFLVKWWHVQSTVHVTTRLICYPELTRPTKIVSKQKKIRHINLETVV